VNKLLVVLGIATIVLSTCVMPAFAQPATTGAPATGVGVTPFMNFGPAFGAGLVIIGAGLGIGRMYCPRFDARLESLEPLHVAEMWFNDFQ
jgi:type II secretory pathway component PulF